MISRTPSQVMDDAMSIDITKPEETGYFPWHKWRMRCVRKAIKELAVLLHNIGFWVAFADTYMYAGKDGRSRPLYYMELEHEYSDMHNSYLDHGEYMEITNSDKELEAYFSVSDESIDDIKKKYGQFDFLTEIVEENG